MSVIDLNKLFPVADDGSQGPLPKQQEFIKDVLDPKGPQNVGYFGGYGSGKSLILVITNIIEGVLYGGEYVIARQFMPELRRTTMRLFHELLPPELIIEKKDAVAETVIKSAKGTARFYFVGLDEPEKLDSLNLDGASIDEASQTSEESFLKLQGRLRGTKGLRKMKCVGNPKGHNYIFKYFVEKKVFKDIISPRTKKVITAAQQAANYKMIVAPSTENHHLPPGYVEGMMATYSPERIKRDIYGSWDSFEGQVFTEFDRGIHVVRPFKIPSNWQRHIRIDHGFRNPAAVLFFAIAPDGEVYVYREVYEREKLIREIVDLVKKSYTRADKFETVKIDPSTRRRDGKKGESDYDEYIKHWPKELPPIGLAKNDVQLGIDRVKGYLKVHPKLQQPMLYIFDTCTELLEEISTYRYPELRPSEQGNKSEKENPLKVNDHAVDALRYMIIDLPVPYGQEEKWEEIRRKKFSPAEIRMQDELKSLKVPKGDKNDPFSDGI